MAVTSIATSHLLVSVAFILICRFHASLYHIIIKACFNPTESHSVANSIKIQKLKAQPYYALKNSIKVIQLRCPTIDHRGCFVFKPSNTLNGKTIKEEK